MESWNKFLVGVRGDKVVVINFPPIAEGLSKSDALLLAAWLVALADDDDKFPALLDRVQSS